MKNQWNGKTIGPLLGYRFFIICIKILGLRTAYFFAYWVSLYFFLAKKKFRNSLAEFYMVGFNMNKTEALKQCFYTFKNFAIVLIDRIAIKTNLYKKYSYSFENEKALTDMLNLKKGGFLISAHVGNWETAGDLLGARITSKINLLILDNEVEKIKIFISKNTRKNKFNIIPIKNDMSHLIQIHNALKNNEIIALHADRIMNKQKDISLPFLNGVAKFPLGPFQMAKKFNAPVSFVFAVKNEKYHYKMFASDLFKDNYTVESLMKSYVNQLETIVKKFPNQWFNFYRFYAC